MELWIKTLHILAVIAWMAGMLYLPRLFVYHCGVAAGSEASETFKIMERRLLKAIINPAMIVTWIAGLEWQFFCRPLDECQIYIGDSDVGCAWVSGQNRLYFRRRQKHQICNILSGAE